MEYSVLEDCVENILVSIKPSTNDNINRGGAINELRNVIKTFARSGATVNPYGSYVSNLHSKRSDLDVSVDGLELTPCITHGDQQYALRRVKVALESAGIARNIRFIPQARVPVLSYESRVYNIFCDVTIDNHVAQIKSKILNKINSLDSRFRDLVLLVKEWAKVENINDPKNGTLNSYSLSLLVLYHLQTCDPPIQPPLREIYKGNVHNYISAGRIRYVPKCHMEECIEKDCAEKITMFKSGTCISRNPSSLSQLFVSFIDKFSSMETFCKDHKISTYRGRFIPFERLLSSFRIGRDLFIEDPFHQSENTARVVGSCDFKKISEAFKKTNNKLSSSQILSNRNSLLSILARPALYSQLAAQYQSDGNLKRDEGSSGVQYSNIGNIRIV